MKFTKMHGLGNDYLYVYAKELPKEAPALSRQLSERHFGVGSDGTVWILPSSIADFTMRVFNADGSEAKMCGNGIRCVGKYVYDKGYTDRTTLRIETLSGIKTLHLALADGLVQSVTAEIGMVTVEPPRTITVLGESVTCTPVSTGNPHAVVFCGDAEHAPLTTVGRAMEWHPAFPDGANVEFVQVLSPTHLRMRVWERGSGITMACGTGSCASVAAAIAARYCALETPVEVQLDGGSLRICIRENGEAVMTGPAEMVCEVDTDCVTRKW